MATRDNDDVDPDAPATGGRGGVDPGLCGSCAHSRLVETRRGSAFRMCGLSTSDPQYRRYPPLPVRSCPGWRAARA